jgi:3-deoxy-manno-octulosonate cytidylyltransferase (CMP-KDO synthetase)
MTGETNVLIVIPARYASTRLPAKPLQLISGKPMIQRVAETAGFVCKHNEACSYVVATDHPAIEDFCRSREIEVVMTSEACRNGTERCWEAANKRAGKPQLVINLQGDNPLCPPWILQSLIDAWMQDPSAAVYTPCVLLDWTAYERMAEAKKTTPYSGTTVLTDKNNYALAFSKSMIPVIRKPEEARKANPEKSPVRRHIGLYAYTYEALGMYASLEESVYEKGYAEGLEQMRFLYNGLRIKVTDADYRGRETTGGVDSPEDIRRVEAIIGQYGELIM